MRSYIRLLHLRVEGVLVKNIIVSLSAAALVFSTSAAGEPMNNQTVLTMEKAGLGEGLIVDKINSEACGYDVSTDSIISLKNAGLSDSVIAAMVRRCTTSTQPTSVAVNNNSSDPKVRHSPGIYLMESWTSPNVLQLLHPSKSSGMKTSGNGSIAFPMHAKLIVPGVQSHVAVQTTSPIFYFYFNTADANDDFGGASSGAESPDEFTLVKMNQRPKDDEREIDAGKASAWMGSVVSFRKGIDPKRTIKFDIQDDGNGIYKVSPDQALDPGEYAFVLTGADGPSRIYDFSIVGPAATAPTSR